MFFGGKGKAQEISENDLQGLLDSLFDSKLGSFKSKTIDLFSELEKSKRQFGEACEKFGRLEVSRTPRSCIPPT